MSGLYNVNRLVSLSFIAHIQFTHEFHVTGGQQTFDWWFLGERTQTNAMKRNNMLCELNIDFATI